jgi:hypothetical protein
MIGTLNLDDCPDSATIVPLSDYARAKKERGSGGQRQRYDNLSRNYAN